MTSQDVRWIQRFKHFEQAYAQLEKAVELSKKRPLSELEEQGIIQAFEFTHELAWNVLKDFLEEQGVRGLYGSKDSSREAFKRGLIENGDTWMGMIQSRNLTSHTYNRNIAQKIVQTILENYYMEFGRLLAGLKSKIDQETA
ncbi:MAG: nucleotidyltransferase [Candidatus Moranbacteria bacterium]|jgi:nucleotidyltransferase substrate binding protein (TIGR01987 family)|nr:nucleotidyltransferase [Candidatus Moranbacteria bacterium]